MRLDSRAARSLLALLVLNRRRLLREVIATELWPDAGDRSSSWLRQSLWILRAGFARAGADPLRVFDIRDDTVAIGDDVAVEVDAGLFEELVIASPPQLERAVRIYRGDLAEELGLEAFAAERERLADVYEDALAELARTALASGDVRTARRLATRLLARDPLREDAHAVLIAGFGLSGSRSQIYRQYRRLREILVRELGVEPLAETRLAVQDALLEVAMRSERRAQAAVAGRDGSRRAADYRPSRRGQPAPGPG